MYGVGVLFSLLLVGLDWYFPLKYSQANPSNYWFILDLLMTWRPLKDDGISEMIGGWDMMGWDFARKKGEDVSHKLGMKYVLKFLPHLGT